MLDRLIRFDVFITTFIGNFIPHNPLFDAFFSFFSLQGSSFLIWVFIIVFSIIFEEIQHPGINKADKKFILFFLTSFTISVLLVNFILKPLFHRLRPSLAETSAGRSIIANINCPKDYSLPSSHAVTAWAAAAILAYFDKKRRYFYYAVAFLISFSRIYLGCHYFFDVAIGGLIGYLISKAVIKIRLFSPHRKI